MSEGPEDGIEAGVAALREALRRFTAPHFDNSPAACLIGRWDCCDVCAAAEHVRKALTELGEREPDASAGPDDSAARFALLEIE